MAEKKLSAAQQRVLNMMRDGWALGQSSGPTASVWLQQGGLGRGGEIAEVRFSTVHSLSKLGLLTFHYTFPTSEYKLSFTAAKEPA